MVGRRGLPQAAKQDPSNSQFSTIRSQFPIFGAVPVSTGIVRQDKRAEVSDLLKPGNFSKLTDNDNAVLAAA